MSFTDQKPRVTTKEDLMAPWGGKSNGDYFRCYLCGHKFKLGDIWRWVFSNGKYCNLITCETCDGQNVLEKWAKMHEEAQTKYWWFTKTK